ncbi:MAG: TonB-dependent receptor [Bacteroidetes bacterium]|nr:TonB-dependent receptor [Bacteroidota bacterium]
MINFRKIFFILSLICFGDLLIAQNKLTGNVINAIDSLSVAGVIINIPALNIQTETDARGNFKINNIPNGYYQVQAIKPGFTHFTEVVFINDSVIKKNIQLKQNPNHLNEIVVYGNQESKKSETANTIDVLDSKTMRELGALSLSDGIAKLPGVNQLSTGAGISKPVIRGLFGNRIQTVLLGMRFDNQQWQDEHGLGLTDIGVDRIEIIKGPTSLFYGSEAMGGVLNIINEKNAPVGKTQADVSTRFFSNTYGYAVDAGVKRSTQKMNWGIRLGNESHADYSDGNNNRVLNSRFGGNVGKAFLGFKHKRWINENNYLIAKNNFGFLMDAYQVFDVADDRLSRSFERPHHTVLINMFTSQNTFLLNASKLKVNLGFHSNNRQEQEGASGISLDMILNTYTGLINWTKNFNETTELVIGYQNQYQTNVNNGSRIIVPNANFFETSLFSYLKKRFKYAVMEGGIRYDHKSIETLSTGVLNSGSVYNPGVNIIPALRNYNTVNGALGISIFDSKHLNIKLNGSSGYRGPNLAELSSNGLHEGSLRYELGNVNLKVEQNICTDVYAEYYNNNFTLFGGAYLNHFFNYIYLQPSNDDYLGFRIYNYIQKDATLQGAEGGIKIHPAKAKFLLIQSSYSGILGKTSDNEYLPFIPAQKINNEVKFRADKIGKLKSSFMAIGYTYVWAQNTPNQFETSTASYDLVNASLGTELRGAKSNLIISLAGNNLLNKAYYDHLSRFKYFGIYNIGRSISLNLKFQFN